MDQSNSAGENSPQDSETKTQLVNKHVKAQTMVKISGNKGGTKEVSRKVKSKDEVKSRSEPQKKPQVSAATVVIVESDQNASGSQVMVMTYSWDAAAAK